MKKNIFKSLLCLFAAATFVACDDVMDDKADIDASHQVVVNVVPTSTQAENITFSSADMVVSLEDSVNILEVGMQLALDEDFYVNTFVSADEVKKTNPISITDLVDGVTYYARPYIITVNGNTVVGETITFSTPVAPIFEIDGTYMVTEYNASKGTAQAQYEVQIAFVEGSETDVLITNIYDFGKTIAGTYNPETQTISVASGTQCVADDAFGYGPAVISGLNASITAFTPTVDFMFTPKGGAMVSSNFAVQVSAGNLDFCFLKMQHL